MKKSNFIMLIGGIIGGIIFSLGMCMALLPEWHAFESGVIFIAIGLAIIIATVAVYLKRENKKFKMPDKRTMQIIIVSVLGALLLGLGMCLCMVWGKIVTGIIIGIIGIALTLCLIPIIKGLK